MAYINGNKPIVTNGLVYALDFGNTKSFTSGSFTAVAQNYQLLPTYITGSSAVDYINGNSITYTYVSTNTYNQSTYYGNAPSYFSGSLASLINKDSKFTISWTAKPTNTDDGVLFSQRSGSTFLHSRINRSNVTLGFFDSGSNSLFTGRVYNTPISTNPTHYTWIYSSGSSTLFLNGIPVTASSTFVQSGVVNTDRFGFNGDIKQLNTLWEGQFMNLYVFNRMLTSDEIYQNYLNVAQRYGLPTAAKPYTLDENALLYISQSNITSSDQINAVNTFVVGLKSASLWDKMTGIYPFIGSNTASQAINLKDPGIFNINYSGSWSVSTSGSQPSSSTAFVNTPWTTVPVSNGFSYSNLNLSSSHISYLSYNLPAASSYLVGQQTNPPSASGGVITTAGGKTIHTFTSSATFSVNTGGVVELLVVGGGAGGSQRGGGGGAGQVLYSSSLYVVSGSYTVTIGNGGSGSVGFSALTPAGSSSFGTIRAKGGGIPAGTNQGQTPGGAAGGGWSYNAPAGGRSITGSDGMGNGGDVLVGNINAGYANAGPGGGGAGENGQSGLRLIGSGGNGLQYGISGTPTFYGGGGGGGYYDLFLGAGAGGLGGGGATFVTGSPNTGGGGGGAAYGGIAGNGGSGIVIVAYSNVTSSTNLFLTETAISASSNTTASFAITSSGNIGLVILSRTGSNSVSIAKNSTATSFNIPSQTGILSTNLHLNALNTGISASDYSPYNISYASVGVGLTPSEITSYSNLIGQLQANLKRQNTLLDNYSGAAAAYSLRRIGPSNYFGPAIRVRRDSDNTLRDIGFTSDGQLDTVGLLDFVGVTGSGFVNTWYDQSGNGYNLAQGTTTAQPWIIQSGSIYTDTNRPAVYFDGGDTLLTSSPTVPTLDYLTAFILGRPLNDPDGQYGFWRLGGTSNGDYKIFFPYGRITLFYYQKGTTDYSIDVNTLQVNKKQLLTIDADNTGIAIYSDGNLYQNIVRSGVLLGGTQLILGGTRYGTSPILYQENIIYPESKRNTILSDVNSNILSAYTTGSDTDYQAFITATGITQPTQSAALETLVSDLKSYGLWNKMKAIYPMITDKNNRFAYSQALATTWNAVNVYVTQSFITAPDGTLTGNFVSESVTTDSHYIYQTIADGLTTGSEYVASIHARFLNRPWIAMETNTGAKAWFNIQTGITGSLTGSNATITAVSGGWYRCALYFTSSVASGPQNIQYNLADANGNLSYAGVAGTGSYLWGAQFENGNVLGPYRATTATGFTTGSMLDQMKYNLKNPADTDAAFRLTYSGSWNAGYSGNKGNGINAWVSTKINASSSFTYRNLHMSYYSRNLFGGGTDMGIYDNPRYLWLDTGGDSSAEFFAFEHRGYYSNPTGKGYCIGTILNTLPANI
jgi:hypothetical protein